MLVRLCELPALATGFEASKCVGPQRFNASGVREHVLPHSRLRVRLHKVVECEGAGPTKQKLARSETSAQPWEGGRCTLRT